MDDKKLIELALSEGPIEETPKTIFDAFAADLNLKPGDHPINFNLLCDYFRAKYDEKLDFNGLGRFLSGTLKLDCSRKKRIIYYVDYSLLNVKIEQMKTEIVKTAYERRKKKNFKANIQNQN